MQDEPSVLASRPGTLHGVTQTFPAGRVCEDCDTILSRYNSSPWCRVHEGPARARLNQFRDFVPHGITHHSSECDDLPTFRCEGRCEGAYPMSHQFLTADQRFCPWCKPSHAVRSDLLELAP